MDKALALWLVVGEPPMKRLLQVRVGATAHVPVVRRAKAELADRARANREIIGSIRSQAKQ